MARQKLLNLPDMVFNSIAFFIFLPLVLLGFYALPHRLRWLWLLLGGFVFYGWWKWEYLSLLLLSGISDFMIAQKIFSLSDSQKRKRWLWLSICVNLGILVLFKYVGAFAMMHPKMGHYIGVFPKIGGVIKFLSLALPVGISFYTFQTMSYTIDVYRQKVIPEKHLGRFLLFVSYFPQLVAGPIERYSQLDPQLKQKVKLLYENFQIGFRFILYGLFIKMCIADNLGSWVDTIYNNPTRWHPAVNWFGMFAFSFQIYADFHGYTTIAKGVAKLFGVNLMDNFNKPYAALSVNEFWKRWHISLTSWFRDYLYIPLGGNKTGNGHWVFNILLVFLISGLWHGANYTFIIWGTIHGIIYLVENKFSKGKRYIPRLKPLGWAFTFLIVTIAWVFFRAENLEIAQKMLSNAFYLGNGADWLTLPWHLVALIPFFIVFDHLVIKQNFHATIDSWSWQKRWFVYSVMLFALINLSGAQAHPFIYFRF